MVSPCHVTFRGTSAVLCVAVLLMCAAIAHGSISIPNFQDGSWELIKEEDWQISREFSPAEKFVYTIGRIRRYHKVGSPGQRGEEHTGIGNHLRAISIWWNDPERPGVDLHAIRTRESGWLVGMGLDILLDVDRETGRLRQTIIKLRQVGPVDKPPTIVITNPYFVPQAPPAQAKPDFSQSGPQKKL